MLNYENDLLIVDELIFDPHLPTSDVIRIDQNYFMVSYVVKKPIQQSDLRPYKAPIGKEYRRASHDYEFYMRHMIPHNGFNVEVKRAITEAELADIRKKYDITDDKISREFEDTTGAIYGAKYAKTYTSVQIEVDAQQAIPLEQKLRNKGIEASNGSPGRVNIRVR